MAQIDPALLDRVERDPEQELNLIIRVQGDLESRQVQLRRAGLDIRRSLRLINGLAGSAKGSVVRMLLTEDWIISIEEDQQVQALGG